MTYYGAGQPGTGCAILERRKMKRCNTLISATLLVALTMIAGAPTSLRAAQHDERAGAEDMAREAIEQLMRALELRIDSLPLYEMPEIDENGDIIIRRKHQTPRLEPGEREPDAPEIEETTI